MRSIVVAPLLTVAVLASAPAAAIKPGPVAPGQPFGGDFIRLRAPRSSGWQLLSDEKGQMVFGKEGEDKYASRIAHIQIFQLPPASTADEMVALIRSGVSADTSATRFKTLKEQFDYTDARGYPCVRYRSDAIDQHASVGLFKHKVLYLQNSALYCRHPRESRAGFMVNYSYRGYKQIDIEADAESFIEDTQVPPVKPAESASAPASAASN